SEPMYFNQLTKKIGIGQQAMLRHLRALEEVGFIQTYSEKSELGAPDRKFYKLDSSFVLSIFSTQDEFSIKFDSLSPSSNKKASDLKDKVTDVKQFDALDVILEKLTKIDVEIKALQEKLHELNEMRQVLLHRTHQIGKSKYDRIGQKVLYQLVTEEHSSIKSMSEKVDEDKKDVRNALDEINLELNQGGLRDKAGELLA
ncbi:MAG: ArsR/SmtB family transcription factor, partial [Nitrosopumilaceae archaeon]